MGKTIFCNIGPRCKKIVLDENELCDTENICNCLLQCCQTDKVLESMMRGNFPVIQRMDEKRNKFVDVDFNEVIENESEVNVLLIPQATTLLQWENVDLSNLENVVVDDNDKLDVKDDAASKAVASIAPKVLNTFSDPIASNSNSSIVSSVALLPESSSTLQQTISSNNSERKLYSLPTSFELPALTKELQKYLDDKAEKEQRKKFIKFWATHLMSLTYNYPAPSAYEAYSLKVIEKYPALKGGISDHDLVKSSLSTYIRNFRNRNKVNMNPSPTSNKRSSIGSNGPQARKLARISCESVDDTDVEKALVELKKCKETDDSKHVLRLLQLSFLARRSKILEMKNALEITEEYPQLKIFSMIVQELCLIKTKSAGELFETVDKELGKAYLALPKKDTTQIGAVIEALTEEQKALVFKKIHEQVVPIRFRKINEPLVTIEGVCKSTQALLAAETSAPRVVFYTLEEGIANAYLVAGKDHRVKIPEPTVSRALVGLLATYYAWNINYPKAYEGALTYLNQILFHEKKHKIKAVHQFVQDVLQAAQSDANE